MKTVSVVGASGFVGRRLLHTLRARGGGRLLASGTCWRSRDVEGTTPLDVTDARALQAHLGRAFDLVVVAAGTKDVARCEADPGYARALNATPVETMVRIVERERLPTRIVYLSTDYVFDGTRGRYRDDEPPSPATGYGRSKAQGEGAALGSASHKVVRSGAVMARGGRFFDWVVGGLRSPGEVRLFGDAWFSPTPAQLLCDALLELLCGFDDVPARVLHAVGDRRMSRLELGRLVAGLVPGARATLVETSRIEEPLLPPDLSLVPSEFVIARQRRSFDEYLAAEVAGAGG